MDGDEITSESNNERPGDIIKGLDGSTEVEVESTQVGGVTVVLRKT